MKVELFTYSIETAAAMVNEHGAVPIDGTIRACYGPNGELYCLPMYVINPPDKYGSSDAMNIVEKVAEKNIEV